MRQRSDPRKDADDTTWFHAVFGAMCIGLIGIFVSSWAEKSWEIFACSLFIGLASTLVGALLGFVFGVPKTVVATGSTPAGIGTTTLYQGNTNLEQISDWLTKILVGAGLVELKNIPRALDVFGSKFIGNNSLGPFGWVAAPTLAIAYCVCGFLLAYLWARIYMISDLEADKAAEAARDAAEAATNTEAATEESAKAAEVAKLAAAVSAGAAADTATAASTAATAHPTPETAATKEVANTAASAATVAGTATETALSAAETAKKEADIARESAANAATAANSAAGPKDEIPE